MSLATLDGTLHRGCGGRYALQSETVTLRISGMAAEVERAFYRCEKCGHENRTIDQRDRRKRPPSNRSARRYDLLIAQGDPAHAGVAGADRRRSWRSCATARRRASSKGWEKGKYLQNREADALLRSLSDRETLERRAAKAGVSLASPESAPGAANSPASPPRTSRPAPRRRTWPPRSRPRSRERSARHRDAVTDPALRRRDGARRVDGAIESRHHRPRGRQRGREEHAHQDPARPGRADQRHGARVRPADRRRARRDSPAGGLHAGARLPAARDERHRVRDVASRAARAFRRRRRASARRKCCGMWGCSRSGIAPWAATRRAWRSA